MALPQTTPAKGGERLQKFLARAGIASRRRAEDLIRAGRVAVDGQVVTTLGYCLDPARARVTVDGQPVFLPARSVVIMLHKPSGYVTTLADPQGRRRVVDLLPPELGRLFPVGRLDYDTTGLLLLTNDGELAHRLMHPRYKVAKTYRATVAGSLTPEVLTRLAQGVDLDGRLARATDLRLVKVTSTRSVVELTIHEGRYHQVKKMLAQVGFPVLKLKRLAYGPLKLGGLSLGRWRELTSTEIQRLWAASGGVPGSDKEDYDR